METINGFHGEYAWLSNMWIAPIILGHWHFRSNEHAYQAAKSVDSNDWKQIQKLESPYKAKRLGRTFKLREDWLDMRVTFMKHLVKAKFDQHEDLKTRLIATKGMEIIEGNSWNDTFWGVCKGIGQNNLGKIIMQYRDTI
jgi:ribA/ribD-fused uncharacterized protein